MTTLETIEDFLAQKRLVFVGVSRDRKHFSRVVFRELKAHGYELVPVNPHVEEIEGLQSFASVAEVPGEIDGVFVMTRPEATLEVVDACARRGIARVWMHRGLGGPGAVEAGAVARCHELGIAVVDGQCPLMFAGQPGWIHRVHRWVKRRRGTLPRAAAPAG